MTKYALKADRTDRLVEAASVFLENLKGKGPVEAVTRSMAAHERRQTDKALSALFDEGGNSSAVLEGVRLAEMFARAATRVMAEEDLVRMMPSALLNDGVLQGLEDEGARTLARLGRRAMVLSR